MEMNLIRPMQAIDNRIEWTFAAHFIVRQNLKARTTEDSSKTMANEHFRTPALMPGTYYQNICDKPLQSTFSSAL